jgi:hypothetical protein
MYFPIWDKNLVDYYDIWLWNICCFDQEGRDCVGVHIVIIIPFRFF